MADERLLVDAKINGQSIRLAFDGGAEFSVLFRRTAEKLNLSVTEPPAGAKAGPGKVLMGVAEECQFQLGRTKVPARFRVVGLPSFLRPKIDGVLAWSSVKDAILRIDAEAGTVAPLSTLPMEVRRWNKWPIRQDQRCLTIALPVSSSGPTGTILIDTGSPYGVQLSVERWKQWRNNHRDRPSTLGAFYTPGIGLKVFHEAWADKLAIGKFAIADVPVSESPPVMQRMYPNHQATLGLFALTRLDMIVDGKNGCIYTRPKTKTKSRYKYNRLGAVFVPADMTTSNDLVAHVAEGSPAQLGGIRNGDVLLRVGDLDVTKWRTDPRVLPLSRFWSRPAGTRVELTIKRGDKESRITIELQDILGQSHPDGTRSAKQPTSHIPRIKGVKSRRRMDVWDNPLIVPVFDLTDTCSWMSSELHERTHSGKYCFGKTPMQTFQDSIELAKNELFDSTQQTPQQVA